MITEWGEAVDAFLERHRVDFAEEEYQSLVKKVHHKALETSMYLHAIGFSHWDIKTKNMVVVQRTDMDDFNVVFIDHGSGQAGNSVSMQFVDKVKTLCCITPNLMFGTATELCAQSRDVFALCLHQLESFIGVSEPGGLLYFIVEDLKKFNMFHDISFDLYYHWKRDGIRDHMQGVALDSNGELTSTGKIIADYAYAYLVLAYTKEKTVMNSIKSMWEFDAVDVGKKERFQSAVQLWSLEFGTKFECLRQGNFEAPNHIFRRLQYGIHPCSGVRPTAAQLFSSIRPPE